MATATTPVVTMTPAEAKAAGDALLAANGHTKSGTPAKRPAKAPGKPAKARKGAGEGETAHPPTKTRQRARQGAQKANGKLGKGGKGGKPGKAKAKGAEGEHRPGWRDPGTHCPATGTGKVAKAAEVTQRINPSGTYRGRVYGYSVAAVVRALGAAGLDWHACRTVCDALGLAVSDGCLKCQAADGARAAAGETRHYGDPAPLTKAQVAALLALAQ